MERNGYKIVFLGPPGAGKGTQAENISKKLGLKRISTGDILREAVSRGTELGKRARKYMEKGELVPDDIVVEIIKEETKNLDGFVLDGFPRNINQAILLDEMLRELGSEVTHVILLDVPDEEIVKRISFRRICPNCSTVYNLVYDPPNRDELCDICGSKLVQRRDDEVEVVLNRLRVYKENTVPLIEHYGDKIHVVDGLGNLNEVLERIVKALCSY